MTIESDVLGHAISSEDLDRQTAAAAALVDKIAFANGIDPDSLSEATYSRMMGAAGAPHETPTPTVSQEQDMSQIKVSTLDVTHELAKRAHLLHGEDVAAWPREKYAEEFGKLASRMADPAKYEQECIAEVNAIKTAEAEKLADEETGARMARGFHAEMKKIAAEEGGHPFPPKEHKGEGKDEDDKKKKKKEEEEKNSADQAIIARAHEILKSASLSTEEFDKKLAAALEGQKTAAAAQAELDNQALGVLKALGYQVA